MPPQQPEQPQQPTMPPMDLPVPPPTPQKSRKPLIIIGVIVTVLVVLALTGLAVLGSRLQEQEQQAGTEPTVSEEAATNLTTYIDSAEGYQLQHPTNWTVVTENGAVRFRNDGATMLSVKSLPGGEANFTDTASNFFTAVTFGALTDIKHGLGGGTDPEPPQKLTVDGKPAQRTNFTATSDKGEAYSGTLLFIYGGTTDKSYSITSLQKQGDTRYNTEQINAAMQSFKR
jgi:hypothetical protein